METAQEDQPHDWKSKYFLALQEVEERERYWSEVERVLQRTVGRIALAALGVHPELDRRIEALREAVRSGCECQELEALARAAAEFASRLPAADGDAVPILPTMAALLEHDALPGPLREHSAALQSRMQALPYHAPPAALLDELVAWLDDAFVATPNPEASTALVHETLFHFIECLEFPEASQGRIEGIKERLAQCAEPPVVAALAQELAAVVQEVHYSAQQEKRELETFLKTITDRLRELDANLRGAHESRRDSLATGRQLQHSVVAEVDNLRSSVVEATELSTLKHAVQQRLDAVQRHVTGFLAAEEDRNREAEERVAQLGQRLQETEAQIHALQEKLRAEHAQAKHDRLTELYNRTAYDEHVELEYERWRRYATPLALALVDVDHFKDINDRYGHLAGDKALKTLAARIRSQVRSTDLVARYGGEEFVILMPNTTGASALAAAEKLRRSVQECTFHYRGEPVPVTVSCGIAEFHDGDDPNSVLRRADNALYAAKDGGRNRCQLELDTPPALPTPATSSESPPRAPNQSSAAD